MAKSKISSNGEKNQTIKHFSSGVISWSFFSDYWEGPRSLFKKINFLIIAIFDADDDKWGIGLEMIENLVAEAKEKHEEIWEKAKVEKKEAGENDVSTVKDTSKRKFMAEELVKHISGSVEKAKQELQKIDA